MVHSLLMFSQRFDVGGLGLTFENADFSVLGQPNATKFR